METNDNTDVKLAAGQPGRRRAAKASGSAFDHLQLLADNLRLIVLGTAGAGLLGFALSNILTPTFTGRTQFLPPAQQQSSASALIQSLGAAGALAGATAGLKNPADQFIGFLKSEGVQDSLVQRFRLQERYAAKLRVDARRALAQRTRISAGRDGIMTLEVDDTSPEFAAQLANAYVEELHHMMGRLALTEAQQRRVYFEKKTAEAKAALDKADQAVQATGISSTAIKSSPQAAVEVVARLRASVTAQEILVASMRGYLSEGSPDIHQAMTQLAAYKQQLREAERAEPSTSPDDTYISKYRQLKYSEALYELFAKQYEIARVDEGREGAVVQVVDPARPPERRSFPKRSQMTLAGAVGGLLLILVFVYGRNSWRKFNADAASAAKVARLKAAVRAAAFGRRPSDQQPLPLDRDGN